MKFAIFIVLTALILSGCLSSVGNNNKEVSTKGEFVKGQVIKGFPNLPIYPKNQIIETYGSKEGWGGAFVSQDNLTKVVNFYGPALAQLGWETTLRQKSSDNYVYEIKNSVYKGEIIVNSASDGKQTAITVAVQPR